MQFLKKSATPDAAKAALKAIIDSPFLLFCAAVIDILFFVALGGILGFFSERILYYVTHAGNLVSSYSQGLSAADSPASIMGLLSNAGAMPSAQQAAWLTLGLFAALFSAYCLFQGTAWFLASRMGNNRNKQAVHWAGFIREFAVITLPWFALFIIYNAIIIWIDYSGFLPETITRFAVLMIFFCIAFYFVMPAYASIGICEQRSLVKRAFRIGIRKAGYFLPAYLLIIAAVIAINIFLALVQTASSTLLLAGGALIFIPFMTWTRVFIEAVFERANKRFK